jgi:hypothetical protein
LGANDLKDIQSLYGAFASILSLYTEFFSDVLQPLVETLAALYKQSNKPELLTNLQRLAPAVIGRVVRLWTFKVNLGFVPAILQFLVDIQVYGLFELAEGA